MELHLLILIFLVEIVKYHSLCIEIPRDDSFSVCSFCVYFDALLWGQMPGGHLLCFQLQVVMATGLAMGSGDSLE